MIFVAKGVFCQNITEKSAPIKYFYTVKPTSSSQKNLNIYKYFHQINNKIPAQGVNNNYGNSFNHPVITLISADHYTRNFGFFCKKELQFEKATKIPFKFRLGSVQYCDWMEGKRNAGILPGN